VPAGTGEQSIIVGGEEQGGAIRPSLFRVDTTETTLLPPKNHSGFVTKLITQERTGYRSLSLPHGRGRRAAYKRRFGGVGWFVWGFFGLGGGFIYFVWFVFFLCDVWVFFVVVCFFLFWGRGWPPPPTHPPPPPPPHPPPTTPPPPPPPPPHWVWLFCSFVCWVLVVFWVVFSFFVLGGWVWGVFVCLVFCSFSFVLWLWVGVVWSDRFVFLLVCCVGGVSGGGCVGWWWGV